MTWGSTISSFSLVSATVNCPAADKDRQMTDSECYRFIRKDLNNKTGSCYVHWLPCLNPWATTGFGSSTVSKRRSFKKRQVTLAPLTTLMTVLDPFYYFNANDRCKQ